MKSSMNGYVS